MKKNRTEKELFEMAAAERLIVPEALYQQIDTIMTDFPGQKHAHTMNLRKALVLAAILVFSLSITAAAAAGILQQRMEAMNKEKIEEFFVQIYQSRLPADNYNRPISKEENLRMDNLQTAYTEQNVFPQKELWLIEQASDYNGRGIAYLTGTGTFFLPEQELTDEQLLQIIDFRYKRDYSLQQMNEMIEKGKAEFPQNAIVSDESIEATDKEILQSDAIWNPQQELTVPYTGELSMVTIGAGNDSIFLGGFNSIHKMTIGSSDSQPFYEDFTADTRILALCQDKAGVLYATGWEFEPSEEAVKPEGGTLQNETHLYLWMIDSKGSLIRKIDLLPYCGEYGGIISRMAVDEWGNIFISGQLSATDNEVLVLNPTGELITRVDTGDYETSRMGGLGIGRDGLAYITIMDRDWNMGIASIDVKKGTLKDIYFGIVPPETIMLDIVAAGSDTDFVFWGYDGIFTYNLGDTSAVNVLPAYEAPCQWEGVMYCALGDGRIVFADSTDYTHVTLENGSDRLLAIPDKITFYYRSTMNKASDKEEK